MIEEVKVKDEILKTQASENETECSSDEEDTPPLNFIDNQWGDNLPQEPTGINYKAKTALFKKAMDKVKICFKKGSTLNQNGVTANVERKGTGSQATLGIKDASGKKAT